MELLNVVKLAAQCVDMASSKTKGEVTKSLKNAGFYEASKPKRLSIINKVTTKPQRIEMVDKLFLAKKPVKGKTK
jgi:ribosomal protein S8